MGYFGNKQTKSTHFSILGVLEEVVFQIYGRQEKGRGEKRRDGKRRLEKRRGE